MKWSLVMKCLWVPLVLLLLQLHRCCLGCLEEERIALLKLKASCNWHSMAYDDGHHHHHHLPSWVDERGSDDCCFWERVHCNATTGRVIQLSLSDISGTLAETMRSDHLDIEPSMWESGCSLNVTLFSTFKELQLLNLSYNEFDGWINNEGFERLVGLRKLEVLDLTSNHFNISIIPSLGELKSLKALSLGQNDLEGSIHLEEFISTLHNLESLDLNFNFLMASSHTNQGSTSLVGSGKLEALDLSKNIFDNHILPVLGTLTSLRSLSLSSNALEGLLHFEELTNLQNLQSLDLSGNYFNCSFQPFQEFLSSLDNLRFLGLASNNLTASSQTMQGPRSLAGLKKLENLNLEDNGFNNSILPFLGTLTYLRILSLGRNSLEGPVPVQELANLHNLQSLDLGFNNLSCSSHAIQALCGLKRLQKLDLSGNNIEGILPLCLQNLTSLTTLDLSNNQFKGNIPSSLITSLSSLSYIDLGYNDFEGTFTFNTFANNSKLEVIDLTSRGNKLEIEFEDSPWIPLFQLKELSLSNNNLNKKMDAIARFLSTQYNLEKVDLSHCNLNGIFTSWLVENKSRLNVLSLRNNSMRGQFLLPSSQYIAATLIDISDNSIGGLLQENIGNIFPNVLYLNLSKNNFQGAIPSSIGYMSSLYALDFSDNNFTGEIPKHMSIGCSSLFLLALSNNRLEGPVFPPSFNFHELFVLRLDNNLFSGNILSGLSICNELLVLDISNNHLTGSIPSWIGNLTSLMVVNLRGNHLQGNIPTEIQTLQHLEFLDLSQNHLSGSMVSLLNSTSLGHLHLEGNGFTLSPSTAFINNNTNLKTLDIRDNELHGGIPNWISALSGLRVVLLKRNYLNGTIPNHLCRLEWIRLLDLSHNSLSGSIPQCFNNISFGRSTDMESISEIGPNLYLELDQIWANAKSVNWLGAIEEIEFMTKSRSSSYRGDILNFMSGIDLSFNALTGDIPHEIGDLNELHALNLSHNHLTGSIPKTFSNLTQIESLDLSYNKLTGKIPSELITLNFLAVFTVAHNNLSGKTPEMKGQFATFDSSSYEGNPFLCGPPLLSKAASSCSSSGTTGESSNKSPTEVSNDMENKYDIDITALVSSFVASYVMSLLGLATILYINPYWRRMWFNFIEECIYSCHDFLSDTYHKLCASM